MRVNIPDEELQIELTHSWFSRLSALLSIMLFGSFITLNLQKTSLSVLITKNGLEANARQIFNIFALAHNDMITIAKIASIVGIVMGTIGLFKRDCKRGLAMLGILLNSFALFLFFTLLNY